ncbi:hypothetical protein ABEV54_03670 [Peribacillus psychrosaccharolyticus]|uniref:hypothetical protein n=1 Tax=Peribacillus psychrosaccharolyticus TaxID=1407 RepID=UPI003D28519B
MIENQTKEPTQAEKQLEGINWGRMMAQTGRINRSWSRMIGSWGRMDRLVRLNQDGKPDKRAKHQPTKAEKQLEGISWGRMMAQTGRLNRGWSRMMGRV